jgi:hypothetical protein
VLKREWLVYGQHVSFGQKVKLWKVAISLAAVGALAAPAIFDTWEVMPGKEVWVPLTEERRQEIESYMEATNICKDEATEGHRFFCEYFYIKPLKEGRESVTRPDLFKYLAIKLAVALPVFLGIFGLAMGLPAIVLRYWRWLRT